MALCAFLKARGRGIKAEMKGSSAVIQPLWGVLHHTEVYCRQRWSGGKHLFDAPFQPHRRRLGPVGEEPGLS